MKRTISSLAVVVAASVASAQTVPPSGAPAGDPSGLAVTAQKRVEQEGYTDVGNLARGADGLWRGTATRGGRRVEVTIDRSGKVFAR